MKLKVWLSGIAAVLFAGLANAAYTTIQVHSTAMGKSIDVSICLPSDYATATAKSYPVAYLTHGSGNDNTTYAGDSSIADFASANGVIIVCPKGGNDWWMDSPQDSSIKYETFVASELVSYIDSNYRTKANKQNRIIAGHSMGGHGAGLIGFRHKDLFSTVGIIMGGVDLTQDQGREDLVRLLGAYDDHSEDWVKQSVITEAAKLANSDFDGRIFVQIGDSDALFLQPNRDLHELFTENSINHYYHEVAGETHNRTFAIASVLEVLNWERNLWELEPADALVIDASSADVTYTDSAAYAASSRIIKTGAYKATLNFATAPSSFKGVIEIREGTLVASANPNFGAPTQIIVKDGATLDVTGLASACKNDGSNASIYGAELVIAGTGVSGAGAIACNKTGGCNYLLKNITLTGDALIKFINQIGVINGTKSKPAEIALNNHQLTLDGCGTASSAGALFYALNTEFVTGNDDDFGSVRVINYSSLFPQNYSMTRGTARNRLIMGAGTTLKIRSLKATCNWTLVQDGGQVTIYEDSAPDSDSKNEWAGPVLLDGSGDLKFNAEKAAAFIKVTGNITNAADGVYSDIATTSHKPGLVTLSGDNQVGNISAATDSTLLIGGGETKIHKRFSVYSKLIISNATVRSEFANGTMTSSVQSNTDVPPELVVDQGGKLIGSALSGEGDQGGDLRLQVGCTDNTIGILSIYAGAFLTNINFFAGAKAGSSGSILQSGGFVHNLYAPSSSTALLGRDAEAYGYLGMSGGTFVNERVSGSTEKLFVGKNGTAVVAVKNGGRLSFDASTNTLFGAYSGSRTEVYVAGGATVELDKEMSFGDLKAQLHSGSGTLTVTGEGSELQAGDYVRALWKHVDASWTVNVNDGGKLVAPRLYRTSNLYPWYLNLNGGVLAFTTAGVDYSYAAEVARMPDQATVYENGVTLDSSKISSSSGQVTLSFPLVKPEGQRVKSIALPAASGFSAAAYLGAPVVTIAGDGHGASAVALYDEKTHTVTGIEVTSPGFGYTSATATLAEGGVSTSYDCAVTLESQPTAGWKGLTSRGSIQITMNAASTFLGDVTVDGGTLCFNAKSEAQGGMPSTAGVILKNGGTLSRGSTVTDKTLAVPFVSGNGQFTGLTALTVNNRIEMTAEDLFAGKHLTSSGDVTIADGAKLVITDPDNLAKYRGQRSAKVIESSNGTVTLGGTFALEFSGETEESTANWEILATGDAIRFTYSRGMVLMVQ